MSFVILKRGAMFGVLFSALTMAAGCGQQSADSDSTQITDASHEGHDHGDGDHEHEEDDGHDHSGWWCAEHGVPEEECSLCSGDAADAFKAKGDWCEKHDRAESQCFKCDPSRAEKFTKLYVAKFGEEPPTPTD